jgi:hypothetical protein
LSPFLADAAGNCDRAEINIEKLRTPDLPGLGQLRLVLAANAQVLPDERVLRILTESRHHSSYRARRRILRNRRGKVETAYEAPTLRAAWLAQAHTRPWTALGLVIAALAILWLVGLSLWRVVLGEADAALGLGMLGGLAGFAATALGAIPGIALRGVSARVEDSMLGLAAGMMLAASSFSLILPGLEVG